MNQQQQAHELNMDAAQREIDMRAAEGEDMSDATIDPRTYAIIKPQDAETLAVLRELVRLHKHWFRGTAYVAAKFEKDNDAVIKRAMAIIARAA